MNTRIRNAIISIMVMLDENPDGYASTALQRELDLTVEEYSGILIGLRRAKYIVINANWVLITNAGKDFCNKLMEAI